MADINIQELEEILRKNPKILDSLHPLERLVVTKLCEGLDEMHRKGKAQAKPSPNL